MSCEIGEFCDGIGDCDVKLCDSTNCDGCCQPDGECMTFQAQNIFECGKTGKACSGCSDAALDCVLGTCVEDQPCLDICGDGCCCTATGQPLEFAEQTKTECGNATQCGACPGTQSCVEGVCGDDPGWLLTIRSAVVSNVDGAGVPWDSNGTAPDPYAGGALGNNNTFPIGWWVTETLDNRLTPNWISPEATYKESDLLTHGLQLYVNDADGFGTFERIDDCDININAGDLNAGTKTFDCGTLVTDMIIDFTAQ